MTDFAWTLLVVLLPISFMMGFWWRMQLDIWNLRRETKAYEKAIEEQRELFRNMVNDFNKRFRQKVRERNQDLN